MMDRIIQPRVRGNGPGKSGDQQAGGSVGPLPDIDGADSTVRLDPGRIGLGAGGGTPLPVPVRGKMEAALGAAFPDVRVHIGPQPARLGASAFAAGPDLYFAPDRYRPETSQGQQLLGHELAHVAQQRAGRVPRPSGGGLAVTQDRALEAEAERLGQRAARTALPRPNASVAPDYRQAAGMTPPGRPPMLDAPASYAAGPYAAAEEAVSAAPAGLMQDRGADSAGAGITDRQPSIARSTIQRAVVKGDAKGKKDASEKALSIAETFARYLDKLTLRAYGELMSGDWKDWTTTPKILNFHGALKSNLAFRQTLTSGYAIEERVYQLLGWDGGEKTGVVKIGGKKYVWSGQGSVLISKGTLPDVILKIEEGENLWEAWFDITSDKLYQTQKKLHIDKKSPPWKKVGDVIYIAEIQYPTIPRDTFNLMKQKGGISEEKAKEMSENFLAQQEEDYLAREERRALIVDIINKLHENAGTRRKNAFTSFRDYFFEGKLGDIKSTTQANTFLRQNNIANVTGQPNSRAKKGEDLKLQLREIFDSMVEDDKYLQNLLSGEVEEENEEENQEMNESEEKEAMNTDDD